MLVIGILLIVFGYIFNIGILVTLGWIVGAIGLILLIAGAAGHAVGGRKHWY